MFTVSPGFEVSTKLNFCHKQKFLITQSLQPDCVNLWYFKFTLLDNTRIYISKYPKSTKSDEKICKGIRKSIPLKLESFNYYWINYD